MMTFVPLTSTWHVLSLVDFPSSTCLFTLQTLVYIWVKCQRIPECFFFFSFMLISHTSQMMCDSLSEPRWIWIFLNVNGARVWIIHVSLGLFCHYFTWKPSNFTVLFQIRSLYTTQYATFQLSSVTVSDASQQLDRRIKWSEASGGCSLQQSYSDIWNYTAGEKTIHHCTSNGMWLTSSLSEMHLTPQTAVVVVVAALTALQLTWIPVERHLLGFPLQTGSGVFFPRRDVLWRYFLLHVQRHFELLKELFF